METIVGTLNYENLEGGVWIFRADDGRQFALDGLDSAFKEDGVRLELKGNPVEAFSFAMVGPVFAVKSASRL